ncbi:cytochrome c-type biogenesis protein CcmH [Enterovibrio sp. ZSDZ42]|uniref:Cytochrome c-type biogenesis protein n=1 Tax=Enterovibrio gelatinilyticus TaxID=2899819 RepID=A0ABT5R485_9GAMM|nr:cytochrome c-type biogenesis protein CcmH [Enterovibrio sp. ZSDZ42]MDD1795080.1 cytochrome c-type biogenesis protein CcmH [Enterovibrio sp. ZSDZ42]
MKQIYLFSLLSLLLSCALFSSAASTSDTTPLQQDNAETFQFSSAENQRLALKLGKTLRCPECQNQNLIESNSTVAQNLLLTVYQQVEAGATEKEVVSNMISQYGHMVHYQPPFIAGTAALWLAPLLILFGFGFFIFRHSRQE